MNEDRVQREKEWHNDTFGSGVREKTDKFYSITGLMAKDLNETINRELLKERTVFLDYGCGSGYYLIKMAPNIKKGTGIDISEALINHARARIQKANIENLEFFVMDAMNTSFKDSYFDIIHGKSILHHLNLEKSLKEIKRILKDGGKAFFVEPLDTNPIIKLYRKMTSEARTMDEQPFKIKDLKLVKSIFKGAEIKYYFCFSLLAVPLRRYKIFGKVLNVLFFMDKIVLHKYSPLKWMAWSCAIVLKN